jgi:uncharacterized protein (TIGR00369 family)
MTHPGAVPADPADVTYRSHAWCFVCSADNPHGLNVDFEAQLDGSVQAEFPCDRRYQGYSGVLHGGVIAALLDGAMAHCLLARGVEGVTVRLIVEFRRPVRVQRPATVRARVSYDSPPLYRVEAEVAQQGEIQARAVGTFMRAELPAPNDTA